MADIPIRYSSGMLESPTLGQGMLIGQIHVDKTVPGSKMHETTTAARKLMHRFKEDQVLQLMDEVEKAS